MKKRFLLPLIAIAAPLTIGIADAAIHMAGCGMGHQGACEELARRKLYGKEDNITDAQRCIKSDGSSFDVCKRVDAEYIPEDLKAPFAAADKKASVLAAKQKALAAKQKEEQAAKNKAALAKMRAAEAKRKAEAAAANAARGEWIYTGSTDPASGKQSKRAYLTSKNSMNFGFPYSGTQYGQFTVRNHPIHGVDAYLQIDEGQLLCDSYSNTNVLIRFDNGAASTYRCLGAASHDSTLVFISDVARLEARMKTAKKMFVTVNVYQEGQRTWEFNVKGYDNTKV